MTKQMEYWLKETSEIKVLSREDALNSPYERLKSIASNNDPTQQKDLMYIEFILCHEGANLNGDWFFRDELENSYYSAVHKVYNWEHNSPIIGTITDAVLVKPPAEDDDQRWRVECAAVVWKWLFPTYAENIKEGALDGSRRNSMECWFSDYVYVVGDESRVYTRDERPELENYIGKSFNGLPVYRGMRGMLFGGAGCVERPADKGAIFKSVARQLNDVTQIVDIDLDKITLDDVEKEVANLNGENKVVDNIDLNGVLPEDDQTTNAQAAQEDKDVDAQPIDSSTSADDKNLNNNTDSQRADNGVQDEDNKDITPLDSANVNGDADENRGSNPPDEDEGGEKSNDSNEKKSIASKSEAALVDDMLDDWATRNRFWDSFDALYYAIDEVLWNTPKEEVQEKMAEEINAFANNLFSLLPTIREYYGLASTKANQDTELEDATIQIEQLKVQLQQVKEEYDSFKEQVEAEKRSAQLEQLAQKRVEDLLAAGLKFSDERLKTISEKVKQQSEEEYLDFKALLVEARYASAAGQKEENSSDATDEGDSQQTNVGFNALASLNLESEKPKNLVEKFSEFLGNLDTFKQK